MAELKKIKSRPVLLQNYAPNVSTPAAFAIDKALSADPRNRFQSYDEFIHNLEYAREQLKKAPAVARSPRVLKMGDPSRGGSWVTFATVAIVLGAGLWWWTSREPTDTEAATPSAETPAPGQPGKSVEERFDGGRKLLVDGKFPEAAKIFRALYDEKSLPEPKNSWAAVHLGLAEYFAGNPGKARSAFKSLRERIAPTAIGLDPKLVAFFNRLSEIASDKVNIPSAEMDKFDKTSYEALAYVVGGAKRWEAGAYKEAVALFRQFQQATPSAESAWVTDFRPLVARCLDEHRVYRDIAGAIEKADTAPAEAEAALKRITHAKTKIRSAGLLKKLTEIETESSGKITSAVTSAKAAMEKKKKDTEAAEEKTLTDAKLAVKTLSENYRFAEAAAAIHAVNVKLESSIAERDLLAKRIDWLVQFKRQLIEDLNTGGCTLPLQRKSGQQIVGGVARATDVQLEVRVQFGSLPIAWSEISPHSVLQMSRFYMKPTLPPAVLADREWQAGVFCLFTQLFNEGQALMDEAATQKAEYQTHRALFFGQPAPEAPKPAPATPTAEGVAPATGLEMIGQPLNPSRPDLNAEIIKGILKPGTP